MVLLKFPSSSVDFTFECPNKFICKPYEYELLPGKYLFELWGGQGGVSDKTIDCCYGGYVAANVTIRSKRKIYIFVGPSGYYGKINHPPLFNGGGSNYIGTATVYSGTGGSASDVRWGMSLFDRFLVSAGGGGSCVGYVGKFYKGGSAGGLTGYTGEGNSVWPQWPTGGSGGMQDGPGLGKFQANYAKFGEGGNGSGIAYAGAGGGGGYYGGGGSYETGGGGGSSFIHQNYKGVILSGEEMMSEPDGSRRKGHIGDGLVRITVFYDEMIFLCSMKIRYHSNFFVFAIISMEINS